MKNKSHAIEVVHIKYLTFSDRAAHITTGPISNGVAYTTSCITAIAYRSGKYF